MFGSKVLGSKVIVIEKSSKRTDRCPDSPNWRGLFGVIVPMVRVRTPGSKMTGCRIVLYYFGELYSSRNQTKNESENSEDPTSLEILVHKIAADTWKSHHETGGQDLGRFVDCFGKRAAIIGVFQIVIHECAHAGFGKISI